MDVTELRAIPLFDGLSDEQLAELASLGEERSFETGDLLFTEGQPADVWWLLLEGTAALSRRVGHEDTVVGTMSTPGQWAGGFQAWDEHGVYLGTAHASAPVRMLTLPATALRDRADAWFPFGVHLIRGLVNTVRSIESRTRQREALVSLGTLAAGLAHEINNPASAATRAVDALEESSQALMSSLGRLAAGSITAEQFVALDALRQRAAPAEQPEGDALAVSDREDALSDWLADRDVDRDWLIAPPLAAAGLDVDWCEEVADLLQPPALGAGLEWVASSLATSALLGEVKDATRRISELVAAVRSYSQLDRATLQRCDVREGLESSLVMLAHELKGGVTVVRDYGDNVPLIEAAAGELNQVWTNLIKNAVDAMAGQGTLRVSTRPTDGGLVVEVEDTGAGMSAEVQAHAFEPFFTTKDVGDGTGLGLDISRKIVVERHGGEIEIDSVPGRTVFRVRLPLAPPSR